MKLSGLIVGAWSVIQHTAGTILAQDSNPGFRTVFQCHMPEVCVAPNNLHDEYSRYVRASRLSVSQRLSDWVYAKVDGALTYRHLFPLALFSLNLGLPAWISLVSNAYFSTSHSAPTQDPKEDSLSKLRGMLHRQGIYHLAHLMSQPPSFLDKTFRDAMAITDDEPDEKIQWLRWRDVCQSFPYLRPLDSHWRYTDVPELLDKTDIAHNETSIEKLTSYFGATVREVEYVVTTISMRLAWLRWLQRKLREVPKENRDQVFIILSTVNAEDVFVTERDHLYDTRERISLDHFILRQKRQTLSSR